MPDKPLSVDQALIRARSLAKRGDLNQASKVYRAVLEKFPGNKRAIEGLKSLKRPTPGQTQTAPDTGPVQQQINGLITLFNQGRLQKALEQGTALARQHPNMPLIQNILGAINAAAGRMEEAAASLSNALRLKPDYVDAHFNLGNVLKALGKNEEAVASYSKTLQLQPDYAGAHNNLGITLGDLGRHEQAIACLAEAVQLNPDFAEAHFNLGNALKALGRPEEAVVSYSRAVQLKPDYAEMHGNLGSALRSLGKHEEAIVSYSRAVRLKPDYAEAHNNLGITLSDLGRHEQAIAGLTKAVELKPDYTDAHYNLGNVLKALGRHEEAVASYSRAVQLNPGYAEAHSNLGTALSDLGKKDEAIASYSRALQLRPGYAETHNNLSAIKTYKKNDPQIEQMVERIADPSVSENDKMHLSFALGKACDDIGDTEGSFRHRLEGNRLRKKELGYDIASDKALFNRIKSIFSAKAPPALEGTGSAAGPDKQPIFIVGMLRSGTSLVEQILASHSQVHGAGELVTMNRIIMPILKGADNAPLDELTMDTAADIRGKYLTELDKFGVDEPRITDKMPLNFRWVGFILAAMPEAKIINLQRDPVATCWSVFRHYFASTGNDYAYDLVDVAEFYKLYADLMSFWRERFPNRIYDLDYEALTKNQEDETRRLLGYCGLGWEDQCLEFHKTERAVKTASSIQVRQAMYEGSSAAWRKYEMHLQPMIRALEG